MKNDGRWTTASLGRWTINCGGRMTDDGRNNTRGPKSEIGDQKTRAKMFLPKASSVALLQPNAAAGDDQWSEV